MRITSAYLTLCAVMISTGGAALAQSDVVCEGGVFDVPKPLVGMWEEYAVDADGTESLVGELHAEIVAGGCGFSQSFTSAHGEFSFMSLGVVDADTGLWTERFIFSDGVGATYVWRPDGARIVTERVSDHGEGSPLKRLILQDITEDAFNVVEMESEDDGETWVQRSVTPTRRVE